MAGKISWKRQDVIDAFDKATRAEKPSLRDSMQRLKRPGASSAPAPRRTAALVPTEEQSIESETVA